MMLIRAAAVAVLMLSCGNVLAVPANSDAPFSFMKWLSDQGWHDLTNERWNIYGQATYISNWKSAFPARYTNLNGTPNSLSPDWERSFTGTTTFYLGAKAWRGGEFYFAPEMISERPLSGLKGLGGAIQNFELQKNGGESATWYGSRLFLRQTIATGGASGPLASGPLQLAGSTSSSRLVFTGGVLSVLDIFDRNAYASDLRQQFVNMAFLTHASYDFAADARGYTLGLIGEYYRDDWSFRLGRLIAPKHPNQLNLDYRPFDHYGDQVEIEHRHVIAGQPGAVRLLAYRNREYMGRWDDAIAALKVDPTKNATTCDSFSYGSSNSGAPDLCWARKPNIKWGVGVNVEQALTPDIGVFFRGMWSDGKTEVYSYTSSDRSISFGGLVGGNLWGRSGDMIGLGYAQSWISSLHAQYLNLGGIDGFIGDGKIRYRPERALDLFYRFNVIRSAWVSLDYQHIANPAYNADRGPLDIYGFRVHFEF